MALARICKSCSQPIVGRYLTALQADWHPNHFCCAVCLQPIRDAQFYVHEGQPCHPTCYAERIAPRCAICDRPLTGRFQINSWGDRYCVGHDETLAQCAYCGRLVAHTTRRTRRRSVEDVSCDVCASTAVETAPQANLLLPGLIAWVEEQGLRLRQKQFRVEVLDRADFNAREGGHRDPLGLTTTKRMMRNRRVERVEIESIAILRGLPVTLFEGVCVHELGHVWLAQHNIVDLPALDEEGFCELLSHRHYTAIGGGTDLFYAERIAQNSNPIYGDGFRKLKRLEARVGFAQIVQTLLRKKQLPL